MLATQDIQHVIDDLESPDCQLTVESALVAIVLCFSLQNTDYRPDSSQISSLKAALITLLQQKPMVCLAQSGLLFGAPDLCQLRTRC
jgi:hypothetical protein